MEEEKEIERPVFQGFNPASKGYSQLPNEWLDEIISQIDNAAELKIVLYVYRHTWGFQEKRENPDAPAKHDEVKHITTDEFAHGRKRKDGTRIDKGTGLGLTTVKDGVAKAIKHGYIICQVDDSDKARIKKYYGLKMQNSDSRNPAISGHIPTSKHRNVTSDKPESDQRTEKETRERHLGKDTGERKNGATQQKSKKAEKHEAAHSFTHSSLFQSQNSFSSSQEKQEEEVALSEEEQVIYDYACQTIFKAKPPRKTAKLKGECAEIAKYVKTVEQFVSLVYFVRALPYIQGQIHLKNLVNELNGWLQGQSAEAEEEQCPSVYVGDEINERNKARQRERKRLREEAQKGRVISSYDDDDYVDDTFYAPKVSDAQIAEKIAYFSTHFGDTANVEANQRKAVQLQRELGVSRENFYDCLFDAQVSADRKEKAMAVFFEELRLIIEEKKAQAAAKP
jgi:hypothetical protein